MNEYETTMNTFFRFKFSDEASKSTFNGEEEDYEVFYGVLCIEVVKELGISEASLQNALNLIWIIFV